MSRTALILLTFSAAFAQSLASIQGTVTDDAGHPVPAAYAVATFQSPTSHSTYSAVTAASGSFAFNNLPAGTYSICVHVPGGPHLNNCQWSHDTQVTVAAGQTLANQTITLTKGALLVVQLADPNKLLTATDDLMIGFYLPTGHLQPLRLATSGPTGRTYEAAVPLSIQTRLSVISRHLVIADDKSNGLGAQALPAGHTAPSAATSTTLTLPGRSATNAPPVILTITGRR